MDVAFDLRGRLQGDGHPANDAGDLAAHDHALGSHGARDLALFADDDLATADVALDLAVDLQRALADDLEALADDLEIVADDRFGGRFPRVGGRRCGTLRLPFIGIGCSCGSSVLGSAVELRVNMGPPVMI